MLNRIEHKLKLFMLRNKDRYKFYYYTSMIKINKNMGLLIISNTSINFNSLTKLIKYTSDNFSLVLMML